MIALPTDKKKMKIALLSMLLGILVVIAQPFLAKAGIVIPIEAVITLLAMLGGSAAFFNVGQGLADKGKEAAKIYSGVTVIDEPIKTESHNGTNPIPAPTETDPTETP